MIRAYIDSAMTQAHYEIIDQPETPYYGEIPGLEGVLASGATLEECRANLEDALDAWLALGLQLGHPLPEVGGITLEQLKAVAG
jgi:predicted RNase H-like HicB family nuclease